MSPQDLSGPGIKLRTLLGRHCFAKQKVSKGVEQRDEISESLQRIDWREKDWCMHRSDTENLYVLLIASSTIQVIITTMASQYSVAITYTAPR